jgi:hypothetical protein
MFIASAANDTLQGRAIHKVNERWGTDFRSWNGRETIGISVCKKKYAPFNFCTETSENGQVKVRVTRSYGCILHSHLRQQVIRKAGPREGWEPFGQWSMKKAEVMAKKVADSINHARNDDSSSSSSSSDEEERTLFPTSSNQLKQLCQNGKCTWKMRGKYDDVYAEIQEADELNDS